jgi:hypothetical protein
MTYPESVSRVRQHSTAADARSEGERNRLLRLVDWRFLLPDAAPASVVCFADGPLARAVNLAFTSVFVGNTRAARDCDLAVAVDPDSEALAAVHSALRPGGAFFSEWRRLPGRGMASVRRRLQATGFEDVRLFLPHPDPAVSSPAAWIDLNGGSALRHYFVENRGRSRTRLRRAARRMARAAAAVAPRLRLMQPICSVARKPGVSAIRQRGGGLREILVDRWPSLELGTAPEPLTWLLLSGGMRSNSKVVVLAFADCDPQPVIALKVPRTPDSAAAIHREANVLRAMAERPGPAPPGGIPRFLFLDRLGALPVLAETALTGVPLLSAWTGDDYPHLALRASAWLADLAGRRAPSPPAQWWPRLVGSTIAEFDRSFGPALDSRLLQESESRLRSLPALPLVCEQRDFSPWNVLLTPAGDLAVVDWESAELDGLPALDLVYFLTYLCFSLDSARKTGRYRESYRGMLDGRTPKGSLAARCFSEYADRIGLDVGVLHPLRLLTWMVHARSEFERLRADFGRSPDVEALREAVCVPLWREELCMGQDQRGSLA